MKTPPAILGKIASSTLLRIEKAKETLPPFQARDLALDKTAQQCAEQKQLGETIHPYSFERAIAKPGLSFICEVKKASPSKGVIAQDFPYLEIAKEYEEGGAAAVSVLTEPEFFLGSDQYLREISSAVKIPALRKDFIIDPYQLYEAKIWGAKAVLLICALLEEDDLELLLVIAQSLALDCLVEIHNEAEAEEALKAGACIIGINNRDLTTFNVDTGLTERLIKKIPSHSQILTVAESGISNTDDIRKLKDTGVDAVLIGETLMRSSDKKKLLKEFISA